MLQLYKPRLEDLWFRQSMMSDEETMSYNHAGGGTIAFPKESWKDWYDYWVVSHENKRFYRYLKDDKRGFVEEIAYPRRKASLKRCSTLIHIVTLKNARYLRENGLL